MINDWTKNQADCLFTFGWICPDLRSLAIEIWVQMSLYDRSMVMALADTPLDLSLAEKTLEIAQKEQSIILST
jgi:hypothetical protein